MKNNKIDEYDDGHSIVDMSNIDRPNLLKIKKIDKEENIEKSQDDRPWEDHSLNKDEKKWAILGTLKATLFVWLIYVVIFGIVVFGLVLYFKR